MRLGVGVGVMALVSGLSGAGRAEAYWVGGYYGQPYYAPAPYYEPYAVPYYPPRAVYAPPVYSAPVYSAPAYARPPVLRAVVVPPRVMPRVAYRARPVRKVVRPGVAAVPAAVQPSPFEAAGMAGFSPAAAVVPLAPQAAPQAVPAPVRPATPGRGAVPEVPPALTGD